MREYAFGLPARRGHKIHPFRRASKQKASVRQGRGPDAGKRRAQIRKARISRICYIRQRPSASVFAPGDADKLNVFVAAQLARRRKERGLKLNHPEASALIADHIMEGARDGRSVSELMSSGRGVVSKEDVLPGVADLIRSIQVEATFEDGTKLVTVHDPVV